MMKNRLKKIRKNKKLTLKEASSNLKEYGLPITADTLSKYERGDREPKLEIWKKLADYFNVSVPYLQGFTNINTSDNFKFNSKKDAIDCIEKIMKALGISKKEIEMRKNK